MNEKYTVNDSNLLSVTTRLKTTRAISNLKTTTRNNYKQKQQSVIKVFDFRLNSLQHTENILGFW